MDAVFGRLSISLPLWAPHSIRSRPMSYEDVGELTAGASFAGPG
jgi:hypothetical protein